MLGNQLVSRIESFADRQRRENPLLALARRGRVDAALVAAYVRDILYLIRHTPIHLELARARAAELGQAALAGHFAAKAREEAGHDGWAEGDASRLHARFGVVATSEPSPSIRELVSYLRREIEREPAAYLAYVLFAEYLTVLLGPEWLDALAAECGLPQGTLDVVERHVELDRDHVEAGLAELESLAGADADVESFHRVLSASMRYFEGFCAELSARATPALELASA